MDINFLNNAFKDALPEQIANQKQIDPEFESDNRPIRRMHLNECAYLPSPKVFEAINEHAPRIHRYPDLNWNEITHALSNYTGMAHYSRQDKKTILKCVDKFSTFAQI